MKYFCCYLHLVFTCLITNAQNNFIKTYGNAGFDEGYSLQQTTDGNIVMAGSTTIANLGKQMSLTKLTPDGNVLWSKHYGGSGDDYARAVITTNDGGFALVGSSNSFFIGQGDDIYVVKTDNNGNLQWDKTYGTSDNERGFTILQTDDGGYFVGGSTAVFDFANDAYAIKISESGDVLWNKIIGIDGNDNVFNAIQLDDRHFITVGTTDNLGGTINFLVNKIANNGTVVWSKTIGGFDEDHPRTVQPTPDGGLLFVGHTLTWGAGGFDILLVKTDMNANVLWAKTYGTSGNDFTEGFRVVDDGVLIAMGRTSGNTSIAIQKTDFNGNWQWTRFFNGTNTESLPFGADNPVLAFDNSYYLVGRTNSIGVGDYDIILIKTDNNMTNIDCSIDSYSTTPTVTTVLPITTLVTPLIMNSMIASNVDSNVGNVAWKISTCLFDAPPIAQFQTDTTRICSNTCIDFFDQSTNNPTQWQWTFEGGTPSTSTDQNPSQICYTMPGMYDVSLTATNAAGNHTILLPDYLIVAAQNSYICQPSPIELLQLHVTEQKDHKLVQWITATETNNDYYSLYTSFDGKDFVWQQNITAKGNSQTATSYHYADFEHWQADKVYYQLYQTDKNGKKSYVGQTFWQQQTPKTLILPPTPNPAHNELHIQRANANNDPIVLEIFDMLGRKVLVHRLNINASTLILPLHLLPAGQYLLRASNNINTETHSFQKTTH